MSGLNGTWELESSENFDEYMKELGKLKRFQARLGKNASCRSVFMSNFFLLGVGFMMRKAAATIKPKVIIKNDGKKWTFILQSSLKTTEINCEEDVEFDEDTADGRKSKTTVRAEGPNKIIQEQKDPKTGKVVTTIVRELIGDKFHQVTRRERTLG